MLPHQPQNSTILSISAAYFIDCVKKLLSQGNHHVCGFDVGVDGIEVIGRVDFSDLDLGKVSKELVIERVHFRDAVSINNCSFQDGVSFRSCRFDHSVDLGKAILRNGLEFISCRVGVADIALDRPALVLDDANIHGDLVFFETTVSGCVLARRLKLSGDATFTACTVEGDSTSCSAVLDLNSSEARGIVFENGRRPAGVEQPIAANLGQPVASRAPRLRRSLFVDRRSDSGARTSVSLRAAQVGAIDIGWSRFEGRVDFAYVKCRELVGKAGAFACREDELIRWPDKDINESFGGAEIKGLLQLWGGEFGLIQLSGIFIAGAMTLIDGHSGQIVVDDAIDGDFGSEKVLVVPSRVGNFFMIRWHCRDFLKLHAAKVSGAADPSGLRGIMIKATQVDRRISLWPSQKTAEFLQRYLDAEPGAARVPHFFALDVEAGSVKSLSQRGCRAFLNPWQRSMSVGGEVNIDQCVIGGNLELTNIRLANEVANQNVMVTNSTSKGHVTFCSPVSYLVGPQTTERKATEQILHLLAEFIAHRGIVPTGARCCILDMHGSQMDDVDLTGLRIRKMRKKNGVHNGVNLADVKVAGKIRTFARFPATEPEKSSNANETPKAVLPMSEHALQFDPGPPPIDWKQKLLEICFDEEALAAASTGAPPAHPTREAAAHIPGTLDVQHSEIGELVISDRSFRVRTQASKASETGIVLDYASINKLYVARPHQSSVTHLHNGFPVPLSLLDLAVKTWFLEEEGGVHVDRETTSADLYLNLLDNDPVFRMSSYLAIQSSLRDRGRSEEARRVFIAGVYRDVRTDSRSVKIIDKHLRKGWWLEHLRRWWSEGLKEWRPREGRYRGSRFPDIFPFKSSRQRYAVVAFFAAIVILSGIGAMTVSSAARVFALSAAKTTGRHLWTVSIVLLLVLLVFFAFRGDIFRLRRPWQEYVGFGLCVIWWAIGALALYFFNQALTQSYPINLISFAYCLLTSVGLGLLLRFLLGSAMVRFLDQLYWSLVDYGTSALRLPAIILVLMFVSFVLVSGERKNFEPTLLAELNEAQPPRAATGDDKGARPADRAAAARENHGQPSKWTADRVPTEDAWVFGERMWMTLRYHVPLVGAIISEEWQPADRPLKLAGMGEEAPPAPWWWPFGHFYWARSRDWYAGMLWLNWILWPLFLPFLIRILARER